MSRFLRTMLLIGGLALLSVNAAGQDSKPAPATDSEGMESAQCTLKITGSPGEAPFSDRMILGLLRSNGVLLAAARDVGVTLEHFDNPARFGNVGFDDTQMVGGRVMSLSGVLTVAVDRRLAGDGGLAERLMTAVCERLAKTLAEAGNVERARMQEQVAGLEEDLANAQRRLRAIHDAQEQILTAAGQSDLSRGAVLEAGKAAEGELRELDLKLVGLHARQKALLEQIARIGKEADAAVSVDPVAVELEKVVKLRASDLDHVRELVQKGMSPTHDTAEAEERLALARAELAKQRQTASQNAGGSLLADLNKDVLQQTVDIAEVEARREFISQSLEQSREKKLLELADRYEREVELPLPAARGAVERATRELEDLRARAREYRALTVTVLGGAAAP